ncbi:MAG: DUF1700 domain-containing protein [Telluria sp.]
MGKMEYLDGLKRSMMGLPPETQAKTLAYYEQRFVDGVAGGRTEEEVGQELDDPKKIAMTLRANAHLGTLAERKRPVNVLRLMVSAVGLAIFNLFMLVPAAVLGALLTAVYACAFAFYLSGVVVTASGLAGANEFVFNEPARHVIIDGRQINTNDGHATVRIGPRGIDIEDDKKQADQEDTSDTSGGHSSVIKEDQRDGTIHIVTDMDAGSRTTQIAVGGGLVLGGIALALLALVVTRYTLAGVKRYLQMNLSLLKGS